MRLRGKEGCEGKKLGRRERDKVAAGPGEQVEEKRETEKKARQKEKERKSRAKAIDKEVATTERKKRDGAGSRWEGTEGVKELDQVTRSVGRVSGLAVAWLSGPAKGGGSIQVGSEEGRCSTCATALGNTELLYKEDKWGQTKAERGVWVLAIGGLWAAASGRCVQ